jgi:hypothetical protein
MAAKEFVSNVFTGVNWADRQNGAAGQTKRKGENGMGKREAQLNEAEALLIQSVDPLVVPRENNEWAALVLRGLMAQGWRCPSDAFAVKFQVFEQGRGAGRKGVNPYRGWVDD